MKPSNIAIGILKVICIIFFTLLTAILLIMILSRNVSFITFDVLWTDEISRYIFVYTVFLGSGLAMIERKHIRVTFLLDKMNPSMRKIFDCINEIVTMLYCIVMIVGGYKLIMGTRKQAVSTLRKYFVMPMAWWNSAILVSSIIMFIAAGFYLYKRLKDNDKTEGTEGRE